MTVRYFIVALVFISCICNKSNAQEHNGLEHEMKGTHRITLGMSHVHISQGKIDGETKWLATPAWAINYDYWLSEKWAIGLHNDIIIESFFIEHGDEELLERAYPVSMIVVGIFKPGKHLSIIGGFGSEFSKGHNLAVIRLGLEYGFHLPKNFEVGVGLVYDDKINYYNSWGLAFTASKLFKKHKHH